MDNWQNLRQVGTTTKAERQVGIGRLGRRRIELDGGVDVKKKLLMQRNLAGQVVRALLGQNPGKPGNLLKIDLDRHNTAKSGYSTLMGRKDTNQIA